MGLGGWGYWTRTSECRSQSPVPYRLGESPSYGVPTGIRTPDTRLRRPLLYPTELWAQLIKVELERVKGIEPSQPAWKAGALPLSYTRILERKTGFEPATLALARRCSTTEPLSHILPLAVGACMKANNHLFKLKLILKH